MFRSRRLITIARCLCDSSFDILTALKDGEDVKLVRLGFYGADGLVTVISSSACIRCFVADRRMAEENDLPDCLTGFNAD